MINIAVEDPERVARGLVQLAQSHRQLCADFLRDHRDGMDTSAVAKFAAPNRMFDRVMSPLPWPSQTCRTITTIGTPCSALRLSALPRTLRPISCRSLIRSASEAPQSSRPQDAADACYPRHLPECVRKLVQGEAEADEMPTRIGTADVRSAC